jgi:hypothetical protein
MPGFIAAGDACPAAAVMAQFLPRDEDPMGVIDALLESQQRIPLARPAGRTGDDEEDAGHGCSGEEEDELGN